MPIFFQQQMDAMTKLAIWKIEEPESFFQVPLQRNITHPHKRLQHLAGRYLLKYLFPDFPLELIRIADTRKPYLENEAYHFSISHCGDYVAVMVSRDKRVGVDIELPTQRVQKISRKFLHPQELQWALQKEPVVAGMMASAFSPDEPVELLTLLWCCKEAVFKWWSYGQVDFREMIRLHPPGSMEDRCLPAEFITPQLVYPLTLHFSFFEELCLAWIVA